MMLAGAVFFGYLVSTTTVVMETMATVRTGGGGTGAGYLTD